MAFNLRRIRCLATQTTAIGFHLMNRAGAFRSIFAMWARLKLDLPLSPRSSASASAAVLLIFYLLPATYAPMILLDVKVRGYSSRSFLSCAAAKILASPLLLASRGYESAKRMSEAYRVALDYTQVNFRPPMFSRRDGPSIERTAR